MGRVSRRGSSLSKVQVNFPRRVRDCSTCNSRIRV
jgi:hypothetical protein